MTTDRPTAPTDLPPALAAYVSRTSGRSTIDDAFAARIEDAHRRGRCHARALVRSHATTDPETLARAENVTVVTDAWAGMEEFTFLGSYASGTITVYDRQVREVATSLPITESTVRDVVIAHELGHHVVNEESSGDDGPLKRLHEIVATLRGDRPDRERTVLVETAAHAFAGVLVDIDPLTHPTQVTGRQNAVDRTHYDTTDQTTQSTHPTNSND